MEPNKYNIYDLNGELLASGDAKQIGNIFGTTPGSVRSSILRQSCKFCGIFQALKDTDPRPGPLRLPVTSRYYELGWVLIKDKKGNVTDSASIKDLEEFIKITQWEIDDHYD